MLRNTGSEAKTLAHDNSTSLESHGLFGWKVTKEVPEIIVDHIDGMTIREYWESKKRFGNGSIQEVH